MNQPRLRFKEFKGEWEKEPFLFLLNGDDGIRRGPFGSSIKKSDFIKDGPYVVYEQQNAIYNRFDTRYRISQKKYSELSKFHLKSDDFIMSGAGTIGKISRVPLNVENGVFNQALIRMRIKFSTDSNYFLQFMRSNLMQKKLKENNPGSAMQNLRAMKEIKNIKINFPNYPEQQKIGQFFQHLDQQIELQSDKLEHLKQSKRGYLQKMFPNGDSNQPRIRFNQFNDLWLNKRLNRYLSKPKKEIANVKSLSDIMTLKLHLHGLVKESNRETLSLNATNYYVRHSGQLIYGKQNFFNGSIALVSPEFNGLATSQDVPSLNINNINKNYLLTYISRKIFLAYSERFSIGTGSKRLHERDFLNLKIKVPSIEEQDNISKFFSHLDHLIDLQQQKVDHLKRQKQAYLQKMFV